MTDSKKTLATFQVNGEPHEVAFAPHKTLLEVLREEMNLTG
ncbi:MAG: (2Fe-2S)-binding protein, partial [Planctomycetes bacterium]|nr:(2Fe-2S)-binding protein [Planctomycetota bacterium]